MTDVAGIASVAHTDPSLLARHRALRMAVIGLISFLTLVDLFAAQAILPTLARSYGVSASAMGLAVNASTLGMAVAGVVVALVGRSLDRRRGIWISLAVLTIPTALLSVATDLTTFAALRIAQGLCMSTAFTLTMAYLAEAIGARESAGAFAAYITGNVASNLFGRLIAANTAEFLGIAPTFVLFAALNLAGAVLVYFSLERVTPMMAAGQRSALSVWKQHLGDPALSAGFAIGFLILFVFLGTFTYVNFVLVAPPLSLGPTALGAVYLVFLPAIFTTPLTGIATDRYGRRRTMLGALVVAALGLPLLLLPELWAVIVGLALVAIGTFCAQAVATGFISRAARTERGAASGLYLASYYLGGLVGSAVLGAVFGRLGWPLTVAAIGAALALAAVLSRRLRVPEA